MRAAWALPVAAEGTGDGGQGELGADDLDEGAPECVESALVCAYDPSLHGCSPASAASDSPRQLDFCDGTSRVPGWEPDRDPAHDAGLGTWVNICTRWETPGNSS